MKGGRYLSMVALGLLLITTACDGADTMAVGQTVSGVQTLTSVKGTFKLGFYNINNTGNWYVCIWYARIPGKTIDWVANRETPLKNNSGTLNLTEAGSLVLSYGNPVFWSTNATSRASSANLNDVGNLIVYGADNKSEITWQSFDNPGNTWLPGMKINLIQKLTTWKSPWDPSSGQYNLQMDPDGSSQFVLMWRSSVMNWSSGVWNGDIFSDVPKMTQNYIFTFSFFENSTYKYFTYSGRRCCGTSLSPARLRWPPS